MKKYYSLVTSGFEADLNIYGDITSYPWMESDVSAYNLSKALAELDPTIRTINVYINSYGGEVAEGLAIYNALKRHNAQIITYCDGFAASIASVIFMAGDKRVMNDASLLMIHNAWSYASGNASELRKAADDLEVITSASVKAYKAVSSIDEDEIKALMDEETWITPEDALSYGFATDILVTEEKTVQQSVKKHIMEMLLAHQEEEPEEEPEADPEDEEEDDNIEVEPDDTSDEEEPEEEPEEEDEKSDEEDEKEEANQMMVSFFNAIRN